MSNAESGFDLFVVRQPGTFYDSKPDQDAAGLLGGHASFFITLSGVFFFFCKSTKARWRVWLAC